MLVSIYVYIYFFSEKWLWSWAKISSQNYYCASKVSSLRRSSLIKAPDWQLFRFFWTYWHFTSTSIIILYSLPMHSECEAIGNMSKKLPWIFQQKKTITLIYGRKIAHATISIKSAQHLSVSNLGYWIKYKNPNYLQVNLLHHLHVFSLSV